MRLFSLVIVLLHHIFILMASLLALDERLNIWVFSCIAHSLDEITSITAFKSFTMLKVIFPISCTVIRWVWAVKYCYIRHCFRPILQYCAWIWGSVAKSNLQKIQVVQSKTLLGIVHSPWYRKNIVIHNDLKILPNLALQNISIIGERARSKKQKPYFICQKT